MDRNVATACGRANEKLTQHQFASGDEAPAGTNHEAGI
jgi:hypothetical protein